MNYGKIAHSLGVLLQVEGMLMSLPLLVSFLYREACWLPLLIVIIAALVISFLALFASVRYYMSMKKMLDAYLADERTSVLVLDEAGIELDKEDGQVLRMAWGNVSFVRTFEEAVCFISDQPVGFMISCLRKYQPEIYAYLKENQIDLKII